MESMGDLDDALSSVSFIRGDENGPSESGLLWSYLNPLVLDVLSILRDLGNPLNVSLVATDSFVPAGSASPGDLLVSTAMSRSFRERQANVQSCWCHSGWRHGVSRFEDLNGVFQPATDSKSESARDLDASSQAVRSSIDPCCFVSFKVPGNPEGVYDKMSTVFQVVCEEYYGCVETHFVFGHVHSAVGVRCTIPAGLAAFLTDLEWKLRDEAVVAK